MIRGNIRTALRKNSSRMPINSGVFRVGFRQEVERQGVDNLEMFRFLERLLSVLFFSRRQMLAGAEFKSRASEIGVTD